MAYCRFSEGDAYLYEDVRYGLTCCCCRFAPLVKTIFTTGKAAFKLERCQQCDGHGCIACMMPGNVHFATHEEAVQHLLFHRESGHSIPQRAIDELLAESRELLQEE